MKTTADEALDLLLSLHDLARSNHPADLGVLAGRLGWGVLRVVRVLAHLERKGLADRERCRLTMTGLSIALAFATRASVHRAA